YHFFADTNQNGVVDNGESLQDGTSDTYTTNTLSNGDVLSVFIGNCAIVATATVVVDNPPTLIIDDPAAICPPVTADLTAAAVTAGSDAGTLAYFTDVALTNAVGDPTQVPIGTYYISLTAANGCVSSGVVTVALENGCNNNPGAALAYDGNGDIVTVADDPLLDLTSEITIEFWCKPNANASGYQIYVMKAGSGGWGGGYGMVTNGSGNLHFMPTGWFGSGHINTSYKLPADQWVHLAATYDGTTSKIYLNGVESFSASTSGATIPQNNLVMGIGGDYGVSSYSFSGSMDEVRVWNKALTVAEIQANMNCEIQGGTTGLIVNYHFNQGEAGEDNSSPAVNTLDDDSGNNLDGALGNFSLTGTASNWVAPGSPASGNACVDNEIEVLGGSPLTSITSGDTIPNLSDGTDFGTQGINGTASQTFTIRNTGSEALMLTGSPIVEITNDVAGVFSVSTQPSAASIAANGSDLTFTVDYTPTTLGNYTAMVSIANDDSDEDPYTFAIAGTTPGCDFVIDSVTPTDQSCPNVIDGTITVNATCNNCVNGNSDLRYAINGGTPQASNIFNNLAAGNYSVTVSNVNGGTCTANEIVTVGDNAPSASAFVLTFEVVDDNDPQTTNDFLIELVNSADFSGAYQVDWGDCSVDNTTYQDAATHTYAAPGVYTISITGDFPAPEFAFSSTKEKLKTIEQWGTQQWTRMANGFSGCTNMTYNATDTPDLSFVTNMSFMFSSATAFNGNISTWNVSNITDFQSMFAQASSFNKDISSWNITNGTTLTSMFNNATSFDQDLGNWNVASNADLTSIFANSGLSTANYDATLTGWANKTTPATNVNMTNQSGMLYCESATDRADLQGIRGWIINGDTDDCSEGAFITTWEVMTSDLSIRIPALSGGYNYFVDWGDGMTDANQTTAATHTYAAAGTYTVTIRGAFPRLYFYNQADQTKIRTIEQWGDIAWSTFYYSFHNCSNLTYNATDAPDLSNVTDMRYAFGGNTNFDGDLNNWDVSNVIYFSGMFNQTDVFNSPLDNWNMSNAEDLSNMFRDAKGFNQPLASWESATSTLANVTSMSSMFWGATLFNQDVSTWNVSNVNNMYAMFYIAPAFNQPLANWERTGSTMANVANINYIVYGATAFNQDISNWNITGATNFAQAIYTSGIDNTNYDRLLNGWGSQTVQPNQTLYAYNLNYCAGEPGRNTLTGAPNNWIINDAGRACDTDAFTTTWTIPADDLTLQFPIYGTNMTIDWGDGNISSNQSSLPSHTYANASNYTIKVNGNISQAYFAWRGDKDQIQTIEQWGTTTWSSMNYAFAGCTNLTLNATDNPDLSNITTLYYTFADAPNFTGDLSGWNVSTVTDMYGTFRGATSFNSNISSWVVDNVTRMSYVFANATSFNQDLSSWKVDNVTQMQAMFRDASSFNQDISGWNTSQVTDMAYLFQNAAAFDQDLGGWDITQLQSRYSLYLALLGTNISTANYDNILIGWEGQAVPNGLLINTDLTYCAGKDARAALVREHSWQFYGDGRDVNICPGAPFVTTWKTTAANETVTIYTNSYSDYNYNIDWGDGQTNSNRTGGTTHVYSQPGDYQVSITGDFPQFLAANFWQDAANARRLMSIDEWGEVEWESMYAAFAYAENMEYNAIDLPDLSQVYSTAYMFYGAKSFNTNLNDWDISKIYNMSGMFAQATSFNGNLSKWDMTNVLYVSSMFNGATSFNQDITNWETGNMRWMYAMFYGATNFDQDLSWWDFSGLDDRYPQWALAYAFGYSGMDTDNYDDLLIRLREQADELPMGINLGARDLTFCLGGPVRSQLINDYNWTVIDAGVASNCFLQPDPTNQLGETTSNPATEEVLLYPNPTSEVITILFNPEQQYERVTIT
ncbi:MAG: BspA family leucine-rich repeat surface protein, partial [Saprospiraceae bacterium]